MASLRTDYVDDVFTGNRKYTMITNSDSTVSFVDATQYTQTGDTYGAADINAQNEVINEKGVVVTDTDVEVSDRLSGNLYFFYS